MLQELECSWSRKLFSTLTLLLSVGNEGESELIDGEGGARGTWRWS